MKIGILSFSIADNAGAMLQLYSLYSYFNLNKEKPVIINYDCKNTYIRQYPHLFNRRHFNKNYFYDLNKHNRYKAFRKNFDSTKIIGKGKIHKIDNKFDCIFIGSDQVFHFPLVEEDIVFLNCDNAITSKGIYTYAASFGSYRPSTLNEKNIYKNCLKTLNGLSVREDYSFLKTLIDNNYSIVCDPSILIGRDFWIDYLNKHLCKQKEKFVFLYYATKELLKEATEYANKHICRIYYAYPLCSIPKTKQFKRVSDDPINFINYINNSEYVFTSSFHCLIFSLFYKKQIYLPVSDDERFSRMKYLINKFDIFDITNSDLIGNLNLNYDYIYKVMKEDQKVSRKYIEDCLNGKYIK